ncbi:PDR/VanB family oxidoreductase [Paenarthrobacter aromaticivorans]|uniref:PDR/VanB family oxidoreductase n=1 Tax=Paenarthrobacter aromaticivorans TaxID=2849150 RepID=A0ABS6I267_9MICC|nr:PDR/VanB family oxidoreductase [Paenarthrobacter sp. MMS21-TAE1-1]MBU8865833.1 PDR/VanB family oxidoreductase [Paenarthrobacter sp. MMS21-TAE1-1]
MTTVTLHTRGPEESPQQNPITDRATAGEPTARTLRVQQKTWESDGVTSVTFADPTGAQLPQWQPGSHLSLHLPNGLIREYSLCSDPLDSNSWTVAVLRTPDSRGGSQHVHEGLPVGALLKVEGPRNNFALEDAGRYVLVAGGIGITPIISMARQLHAAGADWSLLYTGRSRATMAFLPEIVALAPDRITIHADDEANGRYPDLAAAVGELSPDVLVYACGPEPLLKAVAGAMKDETQLRIERFKAPEKVAVPAQSESAFDVVCHSTGQRIPVAPDVSVLAALNNAGIDVPSSCAEGICGTCETRVISGDVEHRDFLLSKAEQAANKSMFVCVSRCRSAELILDL